MDKVFKVFLIIETSRDYERGLLRGIYKYNALHGHWQISHKMPPYVMESYTTETEDRLSVPEVDGLIVRDYPGVERLLSRHVPIVLSSYRGLKKPNACRIITDDQAVAMMAADHFLERGFQHFAFLGFDRMPWSVQRQASFEGAIKNAGFDCSMCQTLPDQAISWDEEQIVLGQWLQALPKPVALFACNDDRARHVVDACERVDVHVPEEVAILGVDDDEFMCNLSIPSISSISLNIEEAGYQAAQSLDLMMQGRRSEPLADIKVLPTRVIVRQSSDVTALGDPVVAEAVRFIRERSHQSIQVSDVVHHVAVSRRGLYERFNQVLHCSVHQYIKKVRIQQIERLLLDTDYSVAEISRMLDFASPDHIAAYFHSLKGMNPLKYRKLHSL